MMRIRSALTILRLLGAAALLTAVTLSSPVRSYASTDLSVYAKKPQAPETVGSSGPCLDQLLAEINARRALVGTPPVVYIAPEANAAVGGYLADLTPQMQAYRSCFHGQNNPVAPAWDYVSATGI